MSHDIVQGIIIVAEGNDLYLGVNAAANNVSPRRFDHGFYRYKFENEAAIKGFLFRGSVSGSLKFDSNLARIRKVDAASAEGPVKRAFDRMREGCPDPSVYTLNDAIESLVRCCDSDFYSVERLALIESAVDALRAGKPIPSPHEHLELGDAFPLLRSIRQHGLSPQAIARLEADSQLAQEVGPFGRTPLHALANVYAWGDMVPEVLSGARMLLERGANPNARDALGETPLHVAVAAYDEMVPIVHLLADHSADIEAKNGEGMTPFHLAVSRGRAASFAALIARGADIEATDMLGRTPAMTAVIRGEDKLLDALLAHGADMARVDDAGKTVVDHARERLAKREDGKCLDLIEARAKAQEERAALASATAASARKSQALGRAL